MDGDRYVNAMTVTDDNGRNNDSDVNMDKRGGGKNSDGVNKIGDDDDVNAMIVTEDNDGKKC